MSCVCSVGGNKHSNGQISAGLNPSGVVNLSSRRHRFFIQLLPHNTCFITHTHTHTYIYFDTGELDAFGSPSVAWEERDFIALLKEAFNFT